MLCILLNALYAITHVLQLSCVYNRIFEANCNGVLSCNCSLQLQCKYKTVFVPSLLWIQREDIMSF